MVTISYEEVRKVELDDEALVNEICDAIIDTVNSAVFAEDSEFDTEEITYDFYIMLLRRVAEELKVIID